MEKEEMDGRVAEYFKKKGLPPSRAVTFADVGIEDRTSRIDRRGDIKDLGVTLAPGIRLNIPLVSANMKDVTESAMAIALARKGGLGFIHQFASIHKRVQEVRTVKRADNFIIDKPWCVPADMFLKDALAFMKLHQTSGVLVTDAGGILCGILTSRDVRFLDQEVQSGELDLNIVLVKDRMTVGLIKAPAGTSLEEAMRILQKEKVEKLPLVNANRKVAGLITAKDILKRFQYPDAARDNRGRLLVGAAIGMSENYLDAGEKLLEAGADVILLDTARANSFRFAKVVAEFKKKFPNICLVAGNVDNAEGARLLIDAGVDVVKVGIGPGSACKTRIETGIGKPQVTAIAECAAIAEGKAVIADGGIREGGELAKALVAGASAVMLGGYFAGTEETPGEVHVDKGRQFKIYRGSASLDLQLDRVEEGSLDYTRPPEGELRRVDIKGPASSLIDALIGKLRSLMSYVNAATLTELAGVKFFEQTKAGYDEGLPKT